MQKQATEVTEVTEVVEVEQNGKPVFLQVKKVFKDAATHTAFHGVAVGVLHVLTLAATAAAEAVEDI